VDIKHALACTEYETRLFLVGQVLPGVPLFSGGAFDAWPARAVDAMAIAREELAHVKAYLKYEVEHRGL
jgi:hypothetical protein